MRSGQRWAFLQSGVVTGVTGSAFCHLKALWVGDGLDGGFSPAWSSRQRVGVLHGAWASRDVPVAAAALHPYPSHRAGLEAARMTWQ